MTSDGAVVESFTGTVQLNCHRSGDTHCNAGVEGSCPSLHPTKTFQILQGYPIIVKLHLPIMSGGVLLVGAWWLDALDLALGGKITSKTQKPEE